MEKFRVIKILGLITGPVFLLDVSSYAKGSGTSALKTEQKNEAPNNVKQKDDNEIYNPEKLEELVREKAKELENQKKYVIETKKDDNNLLGKKRKRSEDFFENPNKLTGEVIDIAGLKFYKFLTNKYGQTLYICVEEPYNLFVEIGEYGYDESVNKGSICFSDGITSEYGEMHLLEHICCKKSIDVGWQSMRFSDTNDEVGMNAFTYYLDVNNNIVEFELELKGKSIADEGFIKNLSDMLLGKGDFVKNFKHIFKVEKNRVISEMNRHQEGIKDGGTNSIIDSENYRIFHKDRFDHGGKCDEVKKLTFENMWRYYNRNVVKGKPTGYFKYKNLKDAEKSIALLKKYYFDYKTEENCKMAKPGKKKLYDDFIKYENVRKEFAEKRGIFELRTGKDGDKKTKKAQNLVQIEYNVYDLDYFKKECMECYNEEYFNSLPEINELNKKYGFKGIKISGDMSNVVLNIYTDNRKILTEKKLKEIEKEIIDIIIGYIDRNEIKFEDLINAKIFEEKKQKIQEKDFNFMDIANKINLSYMLEGKLFSKKYFRFNEKGELENNPKVFEKYCKENYTNILKEVLEKTKRRISVFEREKGEYDIIKDFVDDTSRRYIPIKVKPVNGKKNFDSDAEFAVAQGFLEENIAKLGNDKYKGKFYSKFMTMNRVFNRFIFSPKSNLDIANFEEICKNHLKTDLKNLKLDDSYLNKRIDIYKSMVEKYRQSLLLIEKLFKEKQDKMKVLLKKKKITFKDIRKMKEKDINYSLFWEVWRLVKSDYSEKLKLSEQLEQLDQDEIKLKELEKQVLNVTKNDSTVLSKEAKKTFKKELKVNMKKIEFILQCIKKLLKRIVAIQNVKVNLNGKRMGITPEYIRAIMKNVEFLDYDKVNEEERKKDLEEIKSIKKKFRNKGMSQIKSEILKN